MGAARGQHKGEKRAGIRTRLGGLRWPAAGVAAGAIAVTLAVVMLIGGGPGIEDVASAATRPPTAKVAVVPADSKVLKERVADVRFPNYFGKFGWKAVGTRTDEIQGRDTRTVFYEKDGKRIAYTIVAAPALQEHDWILRSGDRLAYAWPKNDRTCIISGNVDEAMLRKAATWQ